MSDYFDQGCFDDPHTHFCPACEREWTHDEPDCAEPNHWYVTYAECGECAGPKRTGDALEGENESRLD